MNAPTPEQIARAKMAKSIMILEAKSLADNGFEAMARPLYERAGEGEMVLAGLFEEMGEDGDAQISRLSAASCFMKAHQFSRAEALLRELDGAPEAARMLEECRGQRDDPLCPAPPDVHALVQLLTKKGVISEDEWVDALTAATPS